MSLDPMRGVALEMELKLMTAKHIMDAMNCKAAEKFSRDEICILIEWRREMHAEAEVLRKKLVGETP